MVEDSPLSLLSGNLDLYVNLWMQIIMRRQGSQSSRAQDANSYGLGGMVVLTTPVHGAWDAGSREISCILFLKLRLP